MKVKKEQPKTINLETMSSEELALLLEQNYQTLMQVKDNILNIRGVLQSRKKPKEKANDGRTTI